MARALTHLSSIWPQPPWKSCPLQRTASTASFPSCSKGSSGRKWATAPRVSVTGPCWEQRKGSALQGSRARGRTPTGHSSMSLPSGSSLLYLVLQIWISFYFAHDNSRAEGNTLLTPAWREAEKEQAWTANHGFSTQTCKVIWTNIISSSFHYVVLIFCSVCF